MSVRFSSCITDQTLSDFSYVNFSAGSTKTSKLNRACGGNRCLSCGSSAPLSSGCLADVAPNMTQGSLRYQLAVHNQVASSAGNLVHAGILYSASGAPNYYTTHEFWATFSIRADRTIRMGGQQLGGPYDSAAGTYPALDGAWHGVQVPFTLYTLPDGIFGSTVSYIDVDFIVDNVLLQSWTHIALTNTQEYWNAGVFNGRRAGTNIATAVSCLELDDSNAVVDWPSCGFTAIIASNLCGADDGATAAVLNHEIYVDPQSRTVTVPAKRRAIYVPPLSRTRDAD